MDIYDDKDEAFTPLIIVALVFTLLMGYYSNRSKINSTEEGEKVIINDSVDSMKTIGMYNPYRY